MDLPDSGMLNFFNKVLIALSDLTPDGSPCSIESLIDQCGIVSFGGQRAEYSSVIDHCHHCGLLQLKNKHVRMSTLGQKFLDANRDRYFEITEAQKQLIVERILFKGAWHSRARELFLLFSFNQTKSKYELSTIDNILTKANLATVHFLKSLGVIEELEYIIQVETKYSELVYVLTADSKTITEQQLEKIWMENRKLGAQAENAVVLFEQERLKKLGKHAQASLVRRISTANAAAGYDIESFDGSSDDIFPNRFIEVKATHGDEIRFYWSQNEMSVAKKKGESYWIYMMTKFREDRPNECIPIMIRDPEESIKKNNYLTIEAHSFLIREIAVVELSAYSMEEIKWYQLA